MGTIFSKIVSGEIPCYKVAEDNDHLAFLDIQPNAEGHTLCIPKTETDKLFDLSVDEYHALMAFSRRVALAIEKAIPCLRVGMSVIGLEVPHAHVHLIPLQQMADATFARKITSTPERMKAIATQISEHWDPLA